MIITITDFQSNLHSYSLDFRDDYLEREIIEI